MVSNRGVSWSLPKGKIDPGETAIEAAYREVYEETGIKRIKFIKMLGEYSRYRNGPNGTEDKSEFKTIHVFMFRAEKNKLKVVILGKNLKNLEGFLKGKEFKGTVIY